MEERWLGVDCGSVGIKAVLIDEENKTVAAKYMRNRSLVETLPACVRGCIGDVRPAAAGVTGSGRRLAAVIVGADTVMTEIVCHAVAAMEVRPDCKTVLDIGGEDCKIITMGRDMVDFRMNQVCGAGTGAMLDAIAGRLGVEVEAVGEMALGSTERLEFPGKCGVFAQSAVVSRLNAGAKVSDILMGIIRAMVGNFLLLGRGMLLKAPHLFQGGLAKNPAVVKAMQDKLGSPVVVPNRPEYMGAVGVAMLARSQSNGETRFRGGDSIGRGVKTKLFQAEGCENRCEITVVQDDGGNVIGYAGSRCGRCVPT